MYGTTKKHKCPKCGKFDYEENSFCSKCMSELIENKAQEMWGRWSAGSL